jgi:superfamily II DNA or RNA helicase
MKKQLRDYQIKVIDEVFNHLYKNERCCVSLSTGAGKTVIFSELVNRLDYRILICVHREELVYQTSATLDKEHEILVPKVNNVNSDVVVAMVQTLNNRIKKQEIDLNNFDFIIVDECHRGEFMKILDQFNGKVVGFTATPNYEKTRYFYKCLSCGNTEEKSGKCCNKKLKKYKENVPLAEYYDYLIEGVEINDLIKKGYLVEDEQYVLPVDTKRLVFEEGKEHPTEESISLVFGSEQAIQNTINNYFEYCKGLKTIVFNPNTLVNKKLYDAMIDQGINAKMYDSQNSEENRTDLVKWFKETKDAVLLNVQVFTTGFDCTDVQAVMLNKKTKSINLYLQMVGRGGRITDKIIKPSFKVIDLGNNDEDFGRWSKPRDWKDFFYKKEVKKVGTPRPLATRDCEDCGAINSANSLYCFNCGSERKYKGSGVKGLAYRNGKPIIPTPDKIVDYAEKNNLTTLDATKIFYDWVSRMFEKVSFEYYQKSLKDGTLFAKAHRFMTPYYFAIQRSSLEGNRKRTIETFINKAIDEISRRYNSGANI